MCHSTHSEVEVAGHLERVGSLLPSGGSGDQNQVFGLDIKCPCQPLHEICCQLELGLNLDSDSTKNTGGFILGVCVRLFKVLALQLLMRVTRDGNTDLTLPGWLLRGLADLTGADA